MNSTTVGTGDSVKRNAERKVMFSCIEQRKEAGRQQQDPGGCGNMGQGLIACGPLPLLLVIGDVKILMYLKGFGDG